MKLFQIDETDSVNANSNAQEPDVPDTPKSETDELSDTMPALNCNSSGISAGLQRILDGKNSLLTSQCKL